MLKHFVLFRFDDDYCTPSVISHIKRVFADLQAALPSDILEQSVFSNCIPRELNMEVMVELTLQSPLSLDAYLKHPLHESLGREISPHIVDKCSFDYQI